MEGFGMENFSFPVNGDEEFLNNEGFEEINNTETDDNTDKQETDDEGADKDPENNNTAEDDNPGEVGSEDDVNNEGNDGTSSDLYSSLAKVLNEQGLLPSLDITNAEIKNIDDFTNAFRAEQEAQAKILFDEYIKSVDINKIAESRSVIDKLQDVDEDYLKNDINAAKDIIREDFRNQGLNDNQINRIINRLIDLGDEDLIKEALTAKSSLIEIQTQRIQEEKLNMERQKAEAIRQQEELQINLKKTVFETDNLIDGYKPTPALKDKVYKAMTTIVGEDEHGNPINQFMQERAKDPIAFETRMYMLFTLTDGFKNLKGLGVQAKSNAIKDLEKTFKNFNIQNDNTPAYAADKESYFGGNIKLNI